MARESPLSAAWPPIKTTQRLSGASIMGNSPSPCLKVNSAGPGSCSRGAQPEGACTKGVVGSCPPSPSPPAPGRVSSAQLCSVGNGMGQGGSKEVFRPPAPKLCRSAPGHPSCPHRNRARSALLGSALFFFAGGKRDINGMLSGRVGLRLALKAGFLRVCRTRLRL